MAKRFSPEWAQSWDLSVINISFGDGEVEHILDRRALEFYNLKLSRLWSNRQKNFPGNFPTSVMRDNLPLIQKTNYHVFPKSDGIRYMLFLLEDEIHINQSLIFARNNEMMRLLNIKIKNLDYFRGTLFDCEFVRYDDGSYWFQLFDCLIDRGKLIVELPFEERIKRIDPFIDSVENASFGFIKKQPILKKEEINSEFGYPIDGLIGIKEGSKYRCGRDIIEWTTIKYKFSEMNTVDFVFLIPKDSESKGDLLIQEDKKMGVHHMTHKLIQQDVEIPKEVRGEMDCLAVNRTIVECRYENEKWIPYRLRPDKQNANNVTTYELTLKNITENITLDEIIDVLFK